MLYMLLDLLSSSLSLVCFLGIASGSAEANKLKTLKKLKEIFRILKKKLEKMKKDYTISSNNTHSKSLMNLKRMKNKEELKIWKWSFNSPNPIMLIPIISRLIMHSLSAKDITKIMLHPLSLLVGTSTKARILITLRIILMSDPILKNLDYKIEYTIILNIFK